MIHNMILLKVIIPIVLSFIVYASVHLFTPLSAKYIALFSSLFWMLDGEEYNIIIIYMLNDFLITTEVKYIKFVKQCSHTELYRGFLCFLVSFIPYWTYPLCLALCFFVVFQWLVVWFYTNHHFCLLCFIGLLHLAYLSFQLH